LGEARCRRDKAYVKAKQEIFAAADVISSCSWHCNSRQIYLSVFPEDTTSIDDTDILSRDECSDAFAEIKRLAKLPTIEYERQRKASAERLELPVSLRLIMSSKRLR
jgi:hypothetical protein